MVEEYKSLSVIHVIFSISQEGMS